MRLWENSVLHKPSFFVFHIFDFIQKYNQFPITFSLPALPLPKRTCPSSSSCIFHSGLESSPQTHWTRLVSKALSFPPRSTLPNLLPQHLNHRFQGCSLHLHLLVSFSFCCCFVQKTLSTLLNILFSEEHSLSWHLRPEVWLWFLKFDSFCSADWLSWSCVCHWWVKLEYFSIFQRFLSCQV